MPEPVDGKPGDVAPGAEPAPKATVGEDDAEWARALRDEGVPPAEATPGEAEPAKGSDEPAGEPEPVVEGTGEPGADPEEEPAAEEGAEPSGKVEPKPEDDPDRKKLSPELQKVFDKRIGELTGKAKRAEEALEGERTKATELEARLNAQEQELLDLRQGTAAQAAGVPKVFLAGSETELQAREDYLWGVEKFCERHPGGYEGAGSETDPSYTADEIRERLLAVREERQRFLPRARALIRDRQTAQESVKTLYPALLDPQSEDHQQMETILKAYPAMRMRADAVLMIGDMLAGRRARAAKAAGGRPAARPAPKVPMAPTPAGSKGGPMDKGKPKTEGRAERFAASGFSEDSLATVLD